MKKSDINERKRKKKEMEEDGDKKIIPTDKQWDDYVTELLLKEAKIKRESYEKEGIDVYLREQRYSPNVKTNKRFLRTILEHTQDHNQILRNIQLERTRKHLRNRRSSPPPPTSRRHTKSQDSSSSREETDDLSMKESTDESTTKKTHHHPSAYKGSLGCSSSSRHSYSTSPSSSPSCHEKLDKSAEIRLSQSIRVRGRGAIGVRKMDRYFEEAYDPKLDINPHEEYYLIPGNLTRGSNNPMKKDHPIQSTTTSDKMYGPPPPPPPPSSSSSIS
jgi:hypothetical protein